MEQLYSETIVLMFHSRSSDAQPGHGASEQLAPEAAPLTELAGIPHWRRLLSNFAVSPFSLHGLRWHSVEHCFQATKFRTVDPAYYRSFSLDSVSELATSQGAPVKRAGGRRARPLDSAAREAWEKCKYTVLEEALEAKFRAHALHRRALLATRDAKLTHRPARSRHVIVEIGLMRVRKRMRDERDGA